MVTKKEIGKISEGRVRDMEKEKNITRRISTNNVL